MEDKNSCLKYLKCAKCQLPYISLADKSSLSIAASAFDYVQVTKDSSYLGQNVSTGTEENLKLEKGVRKLQPHVSLKRNLRSGIN